MERTNISAASVEHKRALYVARQPHVHARATRDTEMRRTPVPMSPGRPRPPRVKDRCGAWRARTAEDAPATAEQLTMVVPSLMEIVMELSPTPYTDMAPPRCERGGAHTSWPAAGQGGSRSKQRRAAARTYAPAPPRSSPLVQPHLFKQVQVN